MIEAIAHDIPQDKKVLVFYGGGSIKKNGVYIMEDVPNDNLNYLQDKLRNYDTEIVTLSNRYKKFYHDNNLVIIKKT